jgi:hypothetical protein
MFGTSWRVAGSPDRGPRGQLLGSATTAARSAPRHARVRTAGQQPRLQIDASSLRRASLSDGLGRLAQPLCLLLRIRGGHGGSAGSPYGPRAVWPCWSVCLPRNHCHLPLAFGHRLRQRGPGRRASLARRRVLVLGLYHAATATLLTTARSGNRKVIVAT